MKDAIDNLLYIFTSERFATWYNGGGNLDRYLCGDLPTVKIETVREDLAKMLAQQGVALSNFTITSIIILTGLGADKVSLITNLPSPFPKVSSEPLCLNLEVEVGKAKEYVEQHFPGIPIEVIDRTKGKVS